MDIEEFTDEQLTDELLKIVDEMVSRGAKEKEIINIIQIGKRMPV